jgi:hypothetical protein
MLTHFCDSMGLQRVSRENVCSPGMTNGVYLEKSFKKPWKNLWLLGISHTVQSSFSVMNGEEYCCHTHPAPATLLPPPCVALSNPQLSNPPLLTTTWNSGIAGLYLWPSFDRDGAPAALPFSSCNVFGQGCPPNILSMTEVRPWL